MTGKVVSRLVDYPYVVVTVRCKFCSRHVRHYRLARLAHKLGPDADIDTVLDKVACPYGRPANLRKKQAFCGVYFADLDIEPLPNPRFGIKDYVWVVRTEPAPDAPAPPANRRR